MAPNVFAQALRINPLLVIFALLLGGQLYGLIGAFIALPIAAIVRESVVYFRRHLVFERWDLPAVKPARPSRRAAGGAAGVDRRPAGARRGGARGPLPRVRRRAPRRERRTCPACGTELGEPDGEAAATSSGAEVAGGRDGVRARGAARRRADQALRRPRRRCATSPSAPRHGEKVAVIGPNGAGKTTLLQILAGALAAERRVGRACPRSASAGSRSSRRCTRSSRWPRTCGCSRAWRRSPDVEATVARMLDQTGARRPRRRRGRPAVGRQPPAGEHRDRPARRARGAAARRAVGVAGPAPARAAVGVHRRPRPGGHRRWSSRPTTSARPSATPTGCSCSPTASCCSPARRRSSSSVAAGDAARARLRVRVRPLPARAGPLSVRWLLLKDLQILRRSPLLVALLVLYPIVLAVLIGLALSGGPDKPKVAFANLVPPGQSTFSVGGAAARRRRLREPSCSSRSTRSASRRARRRSRRCARARRSARSCCRPTRPSGCAGRSASTAATPPDGRGLLQRRGPGEAPLRRVDDRVAAGRGQRRAVGRRAQARRRATSTSWCAAAR